MGCYNLSTPWINSYDTQGVVHLYIIYTYQYAFGTDERGNVTIFGKVHEQACVHLAVEIGKKMIWICRQRNVSTLKGKLILGQRTVGRYIWCPGHCWWLGAECGGHRTRCRQCGDLTRKYGRTAETGNGFQELGACRRSEQSFDGRRFRGIWWQWRRDRFDGKWSWRDG